MTINLDTLRKTAEAATPGPWTRDGVGVLGAREDWDGGKGPARIMKAMMPWCTERMEANAEHVATFNPEIVLALLSRLEQAEQAVQRVLDLHKPTSDPFGTSCAVCIGDSRRSPYPCDTIRALDGDPRRLADDALGGEQDG